MIRCHKRTPEGTCMEYDHKPRCVWWRETLCFKGWLVPLVLLFTLIMGTILWFLVRGWPMTR